MENHPSTSSSFGFSLGSLSLDIFSLISTYLTAQDIKAARLANRELNFFLSPYLFRSIRFHPELNHLHTLDTISKDGVLSHNVKTLFYDCTRFKFAEPKRNRPNGKFHYKVVIRFDQYSPKNVLVHHEYDYFSKSTTKELIESYHFDTNSTREPSTASQDLEFALRNVLEGFPKISSVVFSTTANEYPAKFENKLVLNRVGNSVIRHRQFLALFQAISRTNHKITKIGREGYWTQQRYPDNLGLSRDYHDENIPGSIKYCFPDYYTDDETALFWKENKPWILSSAFQFDPENLLIVQNVFRNLTHLDLGVTTVERLEKFDGVDNDTLATYFWGDLPKAMQGLTNLREFSLDLKVRRQLDQQLECYYIHDDIAELFESPPLTLPHLTTLKLAQFRTCEASLLSLFKRHPQIQNLSLKFIISITTTEMWWLPIINERREWSRFIELLRGMKLKRLEFQGIEGFGIDPDYAGIENTTRDMAMIYEYIMYGYGENPISDKRGSTEWDGEFW